ncbi:MAG: 50S ribosomal protein L18 [Candidatus Uhrbacteria bacterium]|nr:50S ribosomal protein L18 [Patescibacteria group bacterium]MBU1907479.1 50S ribosomal protein L18 [Patescibacteria group bacterium]
MSKKIETKRKLTARRAIRTRAKLHGTAERPRLSVQKSLTQLRAQIIDDAAGKTLAAVSVKDLKDAKGTKTELAAALGTVMAEKAKAAKVSKVVFDRGANKYHGRVKAFAEAAREGGLEF